MDRQEYVEHLAALCRMHPYVALSVVAWLSATLSLEQLADATRAAEDARREWVPLLPMVDLLEERFGRPEGRG